MNILLLSYYFPPDRAVGGHRAANVADALRAAGHEVDVLAAGDPRGGSRRVERVRPIPTLRSSYRLARGLLASSGQAPPGADDTDETAPNNEVSAWKRWILSLLSLPDNQRGFILPAVRAAARSGCQYDVVYTTAPPFSVHLAGLLITVLTGVRWVAEFRDPWTDNPSKPAFLRSRLSDSVDAWFESLCLGRADLVVTVSSAVGTRLDRGGSARHVITIRNGIDCLQDAPPPADPSRPFTIVYAGSFYHARDPFPFMGAIADLVGRGEVDQNRLRVSLIGTPDSFAGRSISGYIDQQGLSGVVRLEGWMEREQCLAEVRSADALWLLAMDQPEQVPNKLYEYLGTRRPILAVTDRDGETGRMLNLAGGHVVVESNEPAPIRRALLSLLAREARTPVGDPAILADWLTSAQMSQLVRVVEGLDVGG